ncbi:hypothetical protein CYPRO_3088 [Cyclonatronum proteinivorum]|uniref:Uncharacterized protein n=1 Tax=Cyclonatronum proteinivorum TaxID=1457365 RepID=A0A345UPC1_9BACT|nr:DUF6577 family protein [Cyclonatronum proteinivorum]AXJ02323.1 hypothetical protein CYPRO_3088 [Cyclonatronum proteinivorum]
MAANLNDELIQSAFAGQASFTADALHAFFVAQGETDLNRNTLISRIYLLKKRGVLSSCGRGLYTVGGRPALQRLVHSDEGALVDLVAEKLPHIRFAVWAYSDLADLVQTETTQNYLFAETDKEACESVFEVLRTVRKDVFLDPDELVLSRYASMHEKPAIIKPLISEAPLEVVQGRTLPSLEKLCIDPLSEPQFFPEIRGQVYRQLLKTFFGENVINRNTLRRYAARRGMLTRLEELLHSLNLSLKIPGGA